MTTFSLTILALIALVILGERFFRYAGDVNQMFQRRIARDVAVLVLGFSIQFQRVVPDVWVGVAISLIAFLSYARNRLKRSAFQRGELADHQVPPGAVNSAKKIIPPDNE